MELPRTLNLIVNTECGMKCPHCDLPVKYNNHSNHLDEKQWQSILENILPVIKPEVVSISAREPLYNSASREKTKAIIDIAKKHDIRTGFVTNGMKLKKFYNEVGPQFQTDFMDISIDGSKEVDNAIRGVDHFGIVEQFLQSGIYKKHVETLFISTVLTSFNSNLPQLKSFQSWLENILEKPNWALLLLYQNHNVSPELSLKADDIKRVIDYAVSVSPKFDNIFLEVFPGSVPNLLELVEDGILPGSGNVIRDNAGMLCGHIAENLFIRYLTPVDLIQYHMRISPEGLILSPEGFESPEYGNGNFGDIKLDTLQDILKTINKQVENRLVVMGECIDKPCYEVCGAGNVRCSVYKNR